ncbi:MAG TPA: hypothetical protein DEA44_16675, partial [Firmicutes bacterium]|nr:hypothetical protein [Bacillota bacterium]
MARTSPKNSATIQLSQFLGVDFANEETDIDPRRSPYAPNMVADTAGRLEKRVGYKTIKGFPDPVNGLHVFRDRLFVHAGRYLSYFSGEQFGAIMSDNKSVSFPMNGALYILDGENYRSLTHDKETDWIQFRDVEGYVPTTVIGRSPTGGGEIFEPVNLIQPKRTNSFTTDGSATVFQLDADNIDNLPLTVSVGGVEKRVGLHYTVNYAAGKVTLLSAPPNDNGIDSVVITFSKTIEGYADRIKKCTVCGLFGLGNDSRVFLSGNPDYPNMDWQSGLYDPTYFPDTGYTKVGTENTAIMGYIKQYDSMVIVKEQASDETTIFFRTAVLADNNEAIFPVYEGLSGIGAVSKYAFASFPGDQVFLSKNGLYGLDSDSVTNQKSIQLRSYYVNPKLIAEPGLENAVAVVWKKLYILCVNSVCYVANIEQVNTNQAGSKGYEWYYWTNIPATCFQEWNGTLVFGTTDGHIMRFRDTTPDNAVEDVPYPYELWLPDIHSIEDVSDSVERLSATDWEFTQRTRLIRVAFGPYTYWTFNDTGTNRGVSLEVNMDPDFNGVVLTSNKSWCTHFRRREVDDPPGTPGYYSDSFNLTIWFGASSPITSLEKWQEFCAEQEEAGTPVMFCFLEDT